MQVKQFILNSPNIDEYLRDNYDVPYSMNKNEALRDVIDLYRNNDSLLRQLNTIAYDLYKNQDEAFLQNSIAITKYDGLVFKHQSGEYFYVAWNASQIASAVGASGSYSGTDLINEYIKDDK
jgi:hypothetical protein